MKKIISIVLAITLVLTLAATLGACSPAPTAQKEFRVGLECAYAPFNWTDTEQKAGEVAINGGGGYAGGYDIEIAKKIADGLGRKLVVVKTVWDGLVPGVQTGVLDAIIAGMSPTDDRKKSIDFTDKYYNSSIVVIVKKGGKFEKAQSLADLAGAKLTAQLGTTHYDVFLPQITGAEKLPAMEDFGAMRVALQSGAIDGYIAEKPEGLLTVARDPNTYLMLDFAAGKGFQGNDNDISEAIGIKKGETQLAADINKILAGISLDDRKKIMDAALQNAPKE